MNLNNLKEIFKTYKFIILGCLGVIVLGIGIICFFAFNKKMDLNLEAMFDENKLIPFCKDDKCGYLNNKGNVVIEPNFSKVGDFYGEYTYVSKDEANKYSFINLKGEEVLSVESDNEPKYIPEYGIWLAGNKIYDRDLNVIFEGNYIVNYLDYGYFEFMSNGAKESGIVDYKGDVVFKWDEDYISAKVSSNELEKNGYYALVSNFEENEKIISLKNGKELFTLEDPKNTYIREEDDNIFRVIDRSDSFKTKTWFYCQDGKIAYESNESIYSLTLAAHNPDILEIDYGPTYKENNLESQYSYYDVSSGKNVENKPVDKALIEELYGYTIETCDKFKGVKKFSKEVAECTYDEVKMLDVNLYNYLKMRSKEELAILKKDGNSYIFNLRKKKAIKTFEDASISVNANSTFLTITNFLDDGFTKKEIMMYNLLTKKSEVFPKDSEITVGSNYFTVKNDNKTKYYNASLELIYE